MHLAARAHPDRNVCHPELRHCWSHRTCGHGMDQGRWMARETGLQGLDRSCRRLHVWWNVWLRRQPHARPSLLNLQQVEQQRQEEQLSDAEADRAQAATRHAQRDGGSHCHPRRWQLKIRHALEHGRPLRPDGSQHAEPGQHRCWWLSKQWRSDAGA